MQVTDARSLRRLIVSPHGAIADRLRDVIRETGTLLAGHFELDVFRHVPYFLRFSQIGWQRSLLDEVAGYVLDTAPFAGAPATIVCAETPALFLAHALGRKTGNPVVVTAVDAGRQPTATLRRGRVAPHLPILVVADVVTTGRSLLPLLGLKPSTSDILGIVSFAVLSSARFKRFTRAHRLASQWLITAAWRASMPTSRTCRGCARGEPLLLTSQFS